MAQLIKKFKDGYDVFVKYNQYRIQSNKDSKIISLGAPGIGKSYSDLRIAEDLDNGFDINRVAFSPEELLAIVDSELDKGSAIVMEEVGVAMSSRSWYSNVNKALLYFFETCRSRNLILLFNTPTLSFLDSGLRKLFTAQLEHTGIDYKNKLALAKPLLYQLNPSTDKVYRKYLRVKLYRGYGGTQPVKLIRIPLPSTELTAQYEIKKQQFLDKLNKDIKESINPKKPLTALQQRWLELWQQGYSTQEIADSEGYSLRASQFHMQRVKNKGYPLEKAQNE